MHDNVAGFSLANASPTALSKQLGMTWLNASGRVVRRVKGARLPTERPTTRDVAPPDLTLVPSSVRIARTSRATGPIVVAVVRDTTDGTAGALVTDNHGGSQVAPDQLLSSGGLMSTSASSGKGMTTILVPDGVNAVALTEHGVTRLSKRSGSALVETSVHRQSGDVDLTVAP